MSDTSYYIKALDEYLNKDKREKGLIGFGLLVNSDRSEQDLAPQVLQMLVNSDEGRYEDMTASLL